MDHSSVRNIALPDQVLTVVGDRPMIVPRDRTNTVAKGDLNEPDAPAAEQLSADPRDQFFYHIQGQNQQRYLALARGGEYYRYYCNRPNLDKAHRLIAQLQQRGKPAIATPDESGYLVWIHEAATQQAIPWPTPAASARG
ncbi:hypothetical protein [Leptolyngbya sp. KIOST-1]|uniref:hypothetical protein n=1 Tax=Leptolyngbya sp. KIOST-1 TaxID=1229172 RepID=UPI00056C15C2|nr:hypothetical protein [Leptolyngbya sp. KIOST-1]